MGKKIIFFSLVALGLAYYVRIRSASTIGKVIETKSGAIQGIISSSRDGRDFYEWLGIPYAQPPVGQLRFASPRATKPWDDLRDGSKYGSKCIQMQMYTAKVLGNEDCLYLNVHVPKLADVDSGKRKLPVMVWIHGGYFYFMGGDDYRPEYFMDQDVVLVTLNYRLGAFGFVSTADKNIRGNMGLKDQALALKWIKNNIEFFGGDADQITIFGESAGGASVHYQTLTPRTRGLFHKAISQSGVAHNPWAVESAKVSQSYTLKLAKTAGCHQNETSEVVQCLRGLTQEELLGAEMKDLENLKEIRAHRDGHLFKPVVEVVKDEEAFITEHPVDIIASERMHKVPWMTGVVADEGLLPTIEFYRNPESIDLFEADWDLKIARNFGIHKPSNISDVAKKIRNYYFPVSSLLPMDDRLSRYKRMFSDGLFNFQMHNAANVQSKYGPVYMYHYNLKGGPSLATLLVELKGKLPIILEGGLALLKHYLNKYVLGFATKDLGVCHGDELQILFLMPGLFNVKMDDADPIYRFSKDMVKFWVDFASNKTLPQFRGHTLERVEPGQPLMYLELSQSPGVVKEPFENRMKFLKSLNYASK